MVAYVLNQGASARAVTQAPAPAGQASVPSRDCAWTPPVPLTVECVSGLAALDALAAVWNSVVERAGLKHPFVTYEWVRAWCEAQIDPAHLRCYTVRAGEAVVGIAPVIEERRGPGGLLLTRRGVSCPHTPRLDFIVADQNEEAYRLLWSAIAPHGMARMLELQDLAGEGPTLPAIEALARHDGFPAGRHATLDSPCIALAGSWEQYESSLDRQKRDGVRRRMRRLTRLGRVRLETVRNRSELPTALDCAFRLEAAAWKHANGTAVVCRPELVQFYTRMAEGAADRGWLRLQFLTVNDERIAVALCLEYGNRMYSLKTGYNPRYASYSPGQLLFELAIRDAFDRGLDAFDLLGARDAWKLHWTQHSVRHYRVIVFPKTVVGRLAHAARFRVAPAISRSRIYRTCRDWYQGRHDDEQRARQGAAR